MRLNNCALNPLVITDSVEELLCFQVLSDLRFLQLMINLIEKENREMN